MDQIGRLTAEIQKGIAEELVGALFCEPLHLAGAVLPNLDLRGAVFKQPVDLRNVKFQGLAWFHGAVFESSLNLMGAEFVNDARFDDVTFRKGAIFSRVTFNGVPCFDRAAFQERAFLDEMFCSGSLSLQQTRFEASGTLRNTECFGGVWGARMYSRAPLETRGMRVYGRCLLPSAQTIGWQDRQEGIRHLFSSSSGVGGHTKRV